MPTTPPVDPGPIVAAATGFMASKQLFASSEIGVFAALAGGALSAAELAEKIGIPQRTARILGDAMVALGVVDYADGRYRNGAAAQAYLAGDSDSDSDGLDLRPFLAFLDGISYPHWVKFANAMRTAEPNPFDMFAPENRDVFMGGVMTYNALHARMLAQVVDYTPYSRALDLGGLSVEFLGQATLRNPNLRGTFLTSEQMLQMVKGAVNPAYAERIDLVAGDPLTGEIPGRYDLVLLEHVIHRFGVEDNLTHLRRAREVIEPGGRLVVFDFLLDASDTSDGRVLDALHAGEYLNIDGTTVWPEDEVKGWLADTGWKWVETRAVPGSPRALLGEPA